MFNKINLLLIMISTLCGCAELLHNRSFVDTMDQQDEDIFVANRDFLTVSGDSGEAYRTREEVLRRTPVSKERSRERQEESSIRSELENKELALNPYQKSLYRIAQQYMDTDSEKIYFLNLPDSKKVKYLDSRSLNNYNLNRNQSGRELASLQPVYSNALNRGMTKDDVLESWGRPARIDIAGNPVHQNERWAFYGKSGVRYIFFEAGEVQGWNVQ